MRVAAEEVATRLFSQERYMALVRAIQRFSFNGRDREIGGEFEMPELAVVAYERRGLVRRLTPKPAEPRPPRRGQPPRQPKPAPPLEQPPSPAESVDSPVESVEIDPVTTDRPDDINEA